LPLKLQTPENKLKITLAIEEETPDGKDYIAADLTFEVDASLLRFVHSKPRLQYIIREQLKSKIDELLQAYCDQKLVDVPDEVPPPLANPTMPLPPGVGPAS